MPVEIIPVAEDTYAFFLTGGGSAIMIDPGEPAPVQTALRRLQLPLKHILVTHAHSDHTGGCRTLAKDWNCPVSGPPGVPGITQPITLSQWIQTPVASVQALHTPGHTKHHLCYFISGPDPFLFSGDTLFGAGCGRVSDQAYPDMWMSLQQLRKLPPETRVYFGHEYTLENLSFALHLEPENRHVQHRLEASHQRLTSTNTTCPSTLAEECLTNPFLRADDPRLADAIGQSGADPARVFTELRQRKDRW